MISIDVVANAATTFRVAEERHPEQCLPLYPNREPGADQPGVVPATQLRRILCGVPAEETPAETLASVLRVSEE